MAADALQLFEPEHVKDIKATLQTYLPNDKVFVIDDLIDEADPNDFTLVEQAAVQTSRTWSRPRVIRR